MSTAELKGRGDPTIYDVARAAGVAPSTVSRTFARPGRVSFETAQRVRAVAEKLGYRARSVSRTGLDARRATGIVAVVVSDIANPAYVDLIVSAQEVAADAGYTVVLSNVLESERRERLALERALAMVDGIVLVSSRMSDSAIRTLAKQKATVVINRVVNGVSSVVPDNARGTRRAAEHLGMLGHTELTYLAGPEASWADGTRWRALREAAVELELTVRRQGPFSPTVQGGQAAAEKWLTRRTPAVVLFNDLMALGFLRQVRRAGVRVPQDVAVVGFDGIAVLDLVRPTLTSVVAPLRALGATGISNVLALIRGAAPTAVRPMVLPSRLVVRESTVGTGHRGSTHRGGGRSKSWQPVATTPALGMTWGHVTVDSSPP